MKKKKIAALSLIAALMVAPSLNNNVSIASERNLSNAMETKLLMLTMRAQIGQKTAQEKYISKYYKIAVREMYRSGIPASITLAQGLLESNSGLSKLSSQGNNHFGIKCHDWKGKSMKIDDDRKGECFRVYNTADESFRDHSDFLRYRDRYKFLFEYDIKDYKAWAFGLKKAGYATDPAYARKLIGIIERYNLSEYDSMALEAFEDYGLPTEPTITPNMTRKEKRRARRAARKAARRARKAAAISVESASVNGHIVSSPLSLEEPKPVSANKREKFRFSLSRKMYSKNGVPFIYAAEGETYASIADSHNLFYKELLKYNDVHGNYRLMPGTIVYLQPKKNFAAKGLNKYIVAEDGESLRDIAQRFGVRLKSIMRMNGFHEGHQLREGDTVILRKTDFKSRLLNIF